MNRLAEVLSCHACVNWTRGVEGMASPERAPVGECIAYSDQEPEVTRWDDSCDRFAALISQQQES